MSSTADAGYAADQSMKVSKSKCKSKKSKDGKHKWVRLTDGPSWMEECKYCKTMNYGK